MASQKKAAPPRISTESEPAPDGLVLVRASDVVSEAVRFLFDLWIPLRSLTLLVGEGGLGKSTLTDDFIAKATRGLLPGDLFGVPIDVLIATAEDALAVVKARLMAAGAELERVHFVTIRRAGVEGDLELGIDLERVRHAIRKTGARLLVIDPLGAHIGSEINTWNDASVRRVLGPLARLASEEDISVVGIAHVNKSTLRDLYRRVGGSVGFFNAARSVMVFARDPDDRSDQSQLRILAHGKQNWSRPAAALRFRIVPIALPDGIETIRFDWLGAAAGVRIADLLGGDDEEERGKRADARRFLLDNLGQGPRPSQEITDEAAAENIAAATLRRAKEDLGVVSEKTGMTGGWQLRLPSDADG
jgi:putative DNA primase/helicase